MDGLNQLMVGRTTFIIAHRLSTVREADRILVLRSGESWSRGASMNWCAQVVSSLPSTALSSARGMTHWYFL